MCRSSRQYEQRVGRLGDDPVSIGLRGGRVLTRSLISATTPRKLKSNKENPAIIEL